ncbi:hypothetical protein [Nocardia abscessus]|uniref:hypothetical protein n=1 Tax=Nocardia abscessus TaxID=120957 RepID=UPI0002F1B23D|nr:hypothetical protein [Nocardia abscessus]MCC3328260.1 hypothetical protein [Nocardia abscessus]
MSQPSPELEGLPSWKLRLLERIQNTAADHTRVLRQGYPTYQPHYGSGEIPIQTWRTHLRALDADRGEIELHAAAVGLPDSAITAARAAGQRGVRWGDSVHSPRTMRHGEDPVRAHMVEGVAADIWQLEHMAAVKVEHRLRGLDDTLADDPAAREQFDRNMDALWIRAAETAHVIGLSAEERAQLWERDGAGWLKLVSVTVRGYDDIALSERWRAYAWRGIEHDARRALDTLAINEVTTPEPVSAPPAPHLLLDRATRALSTTTPGQVAAEAGLGAAVDAALPADLTAVWDSEPAGEPDIRPPESGSSIERDW